MRDSHYLCTRFRKNNNRMQNRNLISITDLTKEEIIKLLRRAKEFEQNPNQRILEGKVVGSLFFEPSTRTRLSFETAVNRLGGRVIGFSDASTSSQSKGETLKDTIVMVSNYADLIVMRHPIPWRVQHATPARCRKYPSSMPVMVPTSIPLRRCSTSTPSTRHRARLRT